MRLIVISSFYRGYVQQSGNNLFEHELVFQIIGIVLPTDQSVKSFAFIFQGFCFNFELTFMIFKKFMNYLFWIITIKKNFLSGYEFT